MSDMHSFQFFIVFITRKGNSENNHLKFTINEKNHSIIWICKILIFSWLYTNFFNLDVKNKKIFPLY